MFFITIISKTNSPKRSVLGPFNTVFLVNAAVFASEVVFKFIKMIRGSVKRLRLRIGIGARKSIFTILAFDSSY